MGVLEARKDAEVIGYSIVGEKIKGADNVIDYDIREEITKDASNVINANNDTTTGMANIIPGVNAPKLIADTSIAGLPDAEPEGSYYGTVVATSFTGDMEVPPGYSEVYTSEDTTITSNTLPYEWKTDAKGIVFPRGGGYSIDVRFYGTGQSEYTRYDTIYIGDTVIGTHSGWSGTTINYQVNVKKGDTLWFDCYIYNSFPNTTTTKVMGVQYTITPK